MIARLFLCCTMIFATASAQAFGVEGCKGRKDPYRGNPPAPKGMQQQAEHLISVKSLVPDLRVRLAYGTDQNVMGQPFYPPHADCLVLKPLATVLQRVAANLRTQGFGLIAYDCYRPWSVQVELWKACPKRGFVADPKRGSLHNLGAGIDVGLYHLETGAIAEMPSAFDDLSFRSRHNYQGGSKRARAHRRILLKAMKKGGLRAIGSEWWHYELKGARRRYPVLNAPFPVTSRSRHDILSTP
ncbi:MAG: M15 family metallopeptidase [Myxococcota bacterium]|nr:M15 family metallopeptidase [Myxococcota bacterium]